eukprot:TRINITY_DN10750_c0_g2_i1.p2 TRINITY_DN10750_c0_g2~~TRINITY_DN10750_c0_g2_i1.p2  ORF type:complete len:198 (+),score=33.86 TRINITY_DN10750_c0_g2_i1:311-904(+)
MSPYSSGLSRESVVSDEDSFALSPDSRVSHKTAALGFASSGLFKGEIGVACEFLKELLIAKKMNKSLLLCCLDSGAKELTCENLVKVCGGKCPLVISLELEDNSVIGILAEHGLKPTGPLISFEIAKGTITACKLSNPTIEITAKEICIKENNQKLCINFVQDKDQCKVSKLKRISPESTIEEFIEAKKISAYLITV